ncbi:hypothetical protein BDV33DRAFT_185493 [Aspergillus novoparasiticus]|uniref:Uncharacterized protein n=1 Tax=Aspergillus novoparasiticus TaxID=986946 RepID=A0A5N6E685_9EURO|nr:hypothetical protein BDV33DRAFT_185493 [Aspergillus novoparasiticus]
MQFSRPLLFQSTATRSISHPKVSWDTFWAFMRENRQKWVDVYDYSIDEEAKRTERRLVENIIKHWEKDSRTALNCLDIENRISDCCPTPISAPDDSLVVGGHFYTSAHLPSTLEGLSLLEEKQGISNESLEDSHYETLAEIFSSYDQVATPEEVKRAWATCYLFLGSPTKPRPTTSRPTTSRAKFINSLEDFNKRAAESFSQEPE